MKKVMQTKTGIGGNCEGATIATLLGLDLNDIPDFWDGCDIENPTSEENGILYQKNLNAFLMKHGYRAISLGADGPYVDWCVQISKEMKVKHLVGGISPRGYMHSVIWEHGELWHDPHPEGGGVVAQHITFLLPIFGG